MQNPKTTPEAVQGNLETQFRAFQKLSANKPLVHPTIYADLNSSALIPRKSSDLEYLMHDKLQKKVKTAADDQVQRLVEMSPKQTPNNKSPLLIASQQIPNLNQGIVQCNPMDSSQQNLSMDGFTKLQLEVLIQQQKYEEFKKREYQLLSQHINFLSSVKTDREKARKEAASLWSFPLEHVQNMVNFNRNNIQRTLANIAPNLPENFKDIQFNEPLGNLQLPQKVDLQSVKSGFLSQSSNTNTLETMKEDKDIKVKEDDPGSPGKPLDIACEELPVLAEITKEYPNWDLATIFSYACSGKSVNDFRKQKRQMKERRKFNLQVSKMKNAPKEQNKSSNLNVNLNPNLVQANMIMNQLPNNMKNNAFWPL